MFFGLPCPIPDPPASPWNVGGHGDQAPDDDEEAVTGSQLGTVSEDVKEENEDPDKNAGYRVQGGKRCFFVGGWWILGCSVVCKTASFCNTSKATSKARKRSKL